MNDADLARSNGWGVGTRLAGNEGRNETVIEITAVGESKVLAKTVSHNGKPYIGRESVWTFAFRDWQTTDD
ncbi:Uncharacterised protein [Mycobacteroides abscessus subsp. massiliense]|nr:Uncharacterised protein [Mycobacteroides abscessus subsp. massiliense]